MGRLAAIRQFFAGLGVLAPPFPAGVPEGPAPSVGEFFASLGVQPRPAPPPPEEEERPLPNAPDLAWDLLAAGTDAERARLLFRSPMGEVLARKEELAQILAFPRYENGLTFIAAVEAFFDESTPPDAGFAVGAALNAALERLREDETGLRPYQRNMALFMGVDLAADPDFSVAFLIDKSGPTPHGITSAVYADTMARTRGKSIFQPYAALPRAKD